MGHGVVRAGSDVPACESACSQLSAAFRCSEGVPTSILPRSQRLRSPAVSVAQRRLGTAVLSRSLVLFSSRSPLALISNFRLLSAPSAARCFLSALRVMSAFFALSIAWCSSPLTFKVCCELRVASCCCVLLLLLLCCCVLLTENTVTLHESAACASHSGIAQSPWR